MKYFSTLLTRSGQETCGSFATIQLDGRNTLENMIVSARKHLARENSFSPGNYSGFRIYKCQNLGQSEHELYREPNNEK